MMASGSDRLSEAGDVLFSISDKLLCTFSDMSSDQELGGAERSGDAEHIPAARAFEPAARTDDALAYAAVAALVAGLVVVLWV